MLAAWSNVFGFQSRGAINFTALRQCKGKQTGEISLRLRILGTIAPPARVLKARAQLPSPQSQHQWFAGRYFPR